MSEPQQPDLPPYAQPNHVYPGTPQPAQAQPYPPAQPYAQPYGQPPAAVRPGNSLARVAFIVALIVLGIGLLLDLAGPIMLVASNFYNVGYQVLSLVGTAISLVGGGVALILGLIAARRPGSHALAGIAIGIGGAHVASALFGLLSTLIYSFV